MKKIKLPEPSVDAGPPTVHKIMIRRGGTIFGHALLYEMCVWENGSPTGERYGNIQEVWVHPDFREQGYGQKLMDKVLETAQRLGMEYLELTSNEEKRAARNMYRKMGFEITTDGFTLRLKPKKETSE